MNKKITILCALLFVSILLIADVGVVYATNVGQTSTGSTTYPNDVLGLTQDSSGLVEYDDCEDANEWTEHGSNTGATVSADSGTKHDGSYSVHFVQDSAATWGVWYNTFTAQTGEFWFTCWYRGNGG